MSYKLANQKRSKGISIFFLFVFLIEILSPAISFAGTGGPSQPEVSGTSGTNLDGMVNLFSGDFQYSVPLFTLPGPNGGYPFNLNYQSGVGPQTEASWVGLGWNLSAGSIAREMRGLPDDFNGDIVSETRDEKPNITVTSSFLRDFEVAFTESERFGIGLSVVNTSRYNNYNGWTFARTIGVGFTAAELGENGLGVVSLGLNFTQDPEYGNTYTPYFSGGVSQKEGSNGAFNSTMATIGYSANSRYGTHALFWSVNYNFSKTNSKDKGGGAGTGIHGMWASSFPVYMPSIGRARTGTAKHFQFSAGFGAGIASFNFGSGGGKTISQIAETNVDVPAYGYLYLGQGVSESKVQSGLLDFNRQGEGAIFPETPNLAIPLSTPDYYFVSGNGIGGLARAFRSDVGTFLDQSEEGRFVGKDIGVEAAGKLAGFIVGVNGTKTTVTSFNRVWDDYQDSDDFFEDYSFTSTNEDRNYNTDPVKFKFYGDLSTQSQSGFEQLYGELGPSTFTTIYPPALSEDYGFPTFDISLKKEDGTNSSIQDNSSRLTNTNFKSRQSLIEPLYSGEIDDFTDNTYQSQNEANIKWYDLDWGQNSFEIENTDLYTTKVRGELASLEDHEISAFNIYGENGLKYSYGLPAQNLVHNEYSFSIDAVDLDSYNPARDCPPRRVDYSFPDSELILPSYKVDGTSEAITKQEIPSYTYAHHLTSVTGTDYVDITGDGPSDDDLGYWVEFSYVRANKDYKWRTPYAGVNYNPGFNIDKRDDQASFSYGEKEIWYLSSAETKTHIAIFHISKRADGVEALAEYADDETEMGTSGLYKLDSISVYNKADFVLDNGTKPEKVIHLEYDYSLCDGVPNFNTQIDGSLHSYADGKLTLKKVWIADRNSTSGEQNPYKFSYGTTSNQNPDYTDVYMGRWGNYEYAETSDECKRLENPYTPQGSYAQRNDHVSAWSLREITLPSTGKITIEYESDDYAYVEYKRAMRMQPIAGFNNSGSNEDLIYDSSTDDWKQDGTDDRKVYFELIEPLGTGLSSQELEDKVGEYFDNTGQLYYRVKLNLKDPSSTPADPAWEYVSGYAVIEDFGVDANSIVSSQYTRAWVQLKLPEYTPGSPKDIHPITYAGLDFLQANLTAYANSVVPYDPDLSTQDDDKIAKEVFKMKGLSEAHSKAFYKNSCLKQWCSEVDLDNSYIRLVEVDGFKYGGGSRVKKIVVEDNWNEISGEAEYQFGKRYVYETINENGDTISSGVANNEPMIGGEVNPFRVAKLFPSTIPIHTINNLFFEMPANEAYLPAASVGYSEVKELSLNTEDIIDNSYTSTVPAGAKWSSTGVTKHEFYTAKDYPSIRKETQIDYRSKKDYAWFFIGANIKDLYTAAQGYYIELNDMHGKPKKSSKYGLDKFGNLIPTPISYSEYIYHDQDYVFVDEATKETEVTNRLSNLVSTQSHDATFGSGQVVDPSTDLLMGVDAELFFDVRESGSQMKRNGAAGNLNFTFPFALIPGFIPDHSKSINMVRTLVTNKVIHRRGILKKVVQYSDGLISEAGHINYDAASGAPILSYVLNEYGDTVYSYDYPAYWSYPKVGSSDERSGYEFQVEISDIPTPQAGGDLNIPFLDAQSQNTGADQLEIGDEVFIAQLFKDYGMFWVSGFIDISGNDYAVLSNQHESTVVLPGGASPEPLNIRLLRPSEQNLLGLTVGSIVSLSHPIKDRYLDNCEVSYDIPLSGNSVPPGCDMSWLFQIIKELIPLVQSGSNLSGIALNDVEVKSENYDFANMTTEAIQFFGSNGNSCKLKMLNESGNIVQIISELQSIFSNYNLQSSTLPTGYQISGYSYSGFGSPGSSPGSFRYFFSSPPNCLCEDVEIVPPTTVPGETFDLYYQVLPEVLQASAAVLSDEWNKHTEKMHVRPHELVGFEKGNDPSYALGDPLQNEAVDYYLKVRDLDAVQKKEQNYWRLKDRYIYHTNRSQSSSPDLRVDGTFTLDLFDWDNPGSVLNCDNNWILESRLTTIDEEGNTKQVGDILNIPSASLYGDYGLNVVASATRATESEIGFESFEQLETTYKTGDQNFNQFYCSEGNLCFSPEYTVFTSGQVLTYSKSFPFNYGRIGDPNGTGSLDKLIIPEDDDIGPFQSSANISIQITGAKVRDYSITSTAVQITPISLAGYETSISGITNVSVSHLSNQTTLHPSSSNQFSSFGPILANATGSQEVILEGFIRYDYTNTIPASAQTSITDNIDVIDFRSHTGQKSLRVEQPHLAWQSDLNLEPFKEYVFSAWISLENYNSSDFNYLDGAYLSDVGVELKFLDVSQNYITPNGGDIKIRPSGEVINGWQRIEGSFSVPQNAEAVGVKLWPATIQTQSGEAYTTSYFDDIRIHPFEAEMITSVFDKVNGRKVADLDNYNFASFYFYDENGDLYLTKQETPEGVYTVQTTSGHLKSPQ